MCAPAGLLIYQHTTVAAMAAAIECQYGKFELTDVISWQGSFTPIKAGTTFYPGRNSNSSSSGSSSVSTSFTEGPAGPNSRMHSGRDWQKAGPHHNGAGDAAAAAAAAEHAKDAAGAMKPRALGSRALPVWLATVLQIGGMMILGQIAYAFMCAALEVRPAGCCCC
jgi:hypothetical protein